jgi:hypothetical protein
MNKCDKCGRPVAYHEDATVLLAKVEGRSELVLSFSARHIRCDPSRAQYIVDPKFKPPVIDPRPEHDKRNKDPMVVSFTESVFTTAWYEMQMERADKKWK